MRPERVRAYEYWKNKKKYIYNTLLLLLLVKNDIEYNNRSNTIYIHVFISAK